MKNYVYIILDITEIGEWKYKDKIFEFKPIYVGMGIGERYKTHLNISDSAYKKNHNEPKFNRIKFLIESGKSPIVIKLYENLDRETAKLYEIDIIKAFGKLVDNNGILFNITDGGDESAYNSLGGKNPHSKKVYQYSLNGDFLREWDCLREIGRELNVSYNAIGDCCRGKGHTAHGFKWTYVFCGDNIPKTKRYDMSKRNIIIYKFNDVGELIEEYESIILCIKLNDLNERNLFVHLKNGKIYHNYFYSCDKNFIVPKNYNTTYSKIHKIECGDEILYLTNLEAMNKFNVGKYYLSDVKCGRVKKPKFNVVY